MTGGTDARRPDLRLAGTALGCWLAALAGLRLTAVAGVAVAATAAVTAAVLAAVAGRARPRRGLGAAGSGKAARVREALGWVAVAALLGVVLGAVATAARVYERDAGPLAGLARRNALIRAALVVREDPKALASVPGTVLVPARLMWIESLGGESAPDLGERGGGSARRVRLRTSARVVVFGRGDSWRRLLPGQPLEATGHLDLPRGGDLTAAVFAAASAPRVGGAPFWQRAAEGLRAGLRRACAPLPPEPGGLLPGLVIGDTSRLDPALAADFRATGMTHLYAVSGSNTAIVIGSVLFALRRGGVGARSNAACCAVALAGFVILARPSPSVLRAATMGALALIGLAAGRPRAAVPALATAVVALVIMDPALAADPGFALSVLATGGLLLLAPGWIRSLRARRVPPGIAEAGAVAMAAQVACAPVIAALTGTVSAVAVPANLLAAPVVAPATVLGVVATLLSPLCHDAARFVAWMASWPARWLVWLARAGAGAPAAVLPWPAGAGGGLLAAAITLAVLRALRTRLARHLLIAGAVAAAGGAVPVWLALPGWPPPGWIVAVCDVGEGDAVVLPAGSRQAVVVDAGPEPGATDACLRSLGVERVALLVISHFHADHVGGVAGVPRGRPLGAVVMPPGAEPSAGLTAVLAEARAARAPVHLARFGEIHRAGGVRLTVLGPVSRATGTRSDANNNSLVLLARVGRRRILLPGDAEIEEQSSLLGVVPLSHLRADVLKIAHHGSGYQDETFLRVIAPSVALVSVGAGNRFGHPARPVLERLRRANVVVARTDRGGALAVSDDGGRLAVRCHRSNRSRARR